MRVTTLKGQAESANPNAVISGRCPSHMSNHPHFDVAGSGSAYSSGQSVAGTLNLLTAFSYDPVSIEVASPLCATPAEERQSLRYAGTERVAIGHALVDNCSAVQACAAIITHAKAKGSPAYVATANAQHVVLLNKDRRFREIYRRADLVVPDGMSLLFASRLYGRSLQQRVTGVDMFRVLCGLAAQEGLRVFLLGGLPGSAELAGAELKKHFPNLIFSTCCPAVGFETTEAGLKDTADAIRAAKPDLLFVALGAPKQEYWIYEHGLELSVPVSIGVGGSFELISGLLPRAPEWIQEMGFEWLFRLCLEPRRMWRRYLLGNAEFMSIVGRQYLRRVLWAPSLP